MKNLNRYLLLLIMAACPQFIFAQNIADMSSSTVFTILSVFVLIMSLLVLVIAYTVYRILKVMLQKELEKKSVAGIEVEPEPGEFKKFWDSLTGAVPMAEEDTILLDHNYDGIQELDNHLPPWWKALFYGGIVFGVIYLINYHVLETSPLQIEEYETEMAEAEEASLKRLASVGGVAIDENTVRFSNDASILADGKKVYDLNCAACHRADGGGGIGPNMTDKYWIHGGGIKNIFATIKNGVTEKGMISWEPLLSPTQMSNVSSYIMSLEGSNPVGAKEQQGERYVAEEMTEVVEETIQIQTDSVALSMSKE